MLYKRSDHTANVLPGFSGNRTWIVLVGGCVAQLPCPEHTNCACAAITNATTAYHPDTDTWVELARAPRLRYRHSSAVVGTKLYVFGGRRVDDSLITDVDVFDATTLAWTTTTPWTNATSDQTSFVYNDTIYAVGGYDSFYNSLTTSYIFRPNAEAQWLPNLVAPLRLGRGDSCASIIDGLGYVLGGWNSVETFCVPLDEIEAYNFTTNTWTTVTHAPARGGDRSCAGLHHELYVFGGEQKDDGCNNVSTPILEVDSYSPTTSSWAVDTQLRVARFRFAAVEYRNSTVDQLYIFGGQSPFNWTLEYNELLDLVEVWTDPVSASTSVVTASVLTTGVNVASVLAPLATVLAASITAVAAVVVW